MCPLEQTCPEMGRSKNQGVKKHWHSSTVKRIIPFCLVLTNKPFSVSCQNVCLPLIKLHIFIAQNYYNVYETGSLKGTISLRIGSFSSNQRASLIRNQLLVISNTILINWKQLGYDSDVQLLFWITHRVLFAMFLAWYESWFPKVPENRKVWDTVISSSLKINCLGF